MSNVNSGNAIIAHCNESAAAMVSVLGTAADNRMDAICKRQDVIADAVMDVLRRIEKLDAMVFEEAYAGTHNTIGLETITKWMDAIEDWGQIEWEPNEKGDYLVKNNLLAVLFMQIATLEKRIEQLEKNRPADRQQGD